MKNKFLYFLTIFSGTLAISCSGNKPVLPNSENTTIKFMQSNQTNLDTATFGNGCFWCTEAIFESLNGVQSAVSGYMGGKTLNPTYKDVCTGLTGHAEVIRIVYDPAIITFEELLNAFWSSHDPTTLNRQGNDVGTQYRSVIFFHNNEQKVAAESIKAELNRQGVFPNPIVTEITPASTFYEAENYHQAYFELNGTEPYCSFVIKPKLDKFKKAFADKIKR